MTELAKLLATCDAHGIRLLPSGDGGLTIDAPKEALTRDLICRLKTHKGELLTLLRTMPGTPVATREATAEPTMPVCRCGSTRWCDVPIHNGQSVRRDCGRCRRFIDFPVWYGKDTLRNEQ